jgi:hypothetical protein
MKGFADFELDLREALLDKLVVKFEEMDSGELSEAAAGKLPDAQGVYQLLLDDQLVYVGKTDADAGLRSRLRRHARKILHRKNLDSGRVRFKALRIYVFTPLDIEAELIKRCRGKSVILWNGSGFGSNDPGRERDTTKLKKNHFDLRHPIDLDRNIELPGARTVSAADALAILRSAVPYLIRSAADGRKPDQDLSSTAVRLPRVKTTARTVIASIVSELPAGWQATALPGYVILYKEHRDYSHGEVIARSWTERSSR